MPPAKAPSSAQEARVIKGPGGTDLSRAEATRGRILDAAVRAFADKGFHGTTTRDITSACGLSSAGLYVHHKSKEELLYQISLAGHETTLEVVRASKAAATEPSEQLASTMKAFAAHHAREPMRGRVVNYELAALSPAHYREIRAIREQISDEVRGIVDAGLAAGVFDTPDARKAAGALISLGVDVARWYREGGSWTPEDIAEFYAGLALRIVGAAGHSQDDSKS
jgi:AcrR family transcriptional regulator